MKIIVKENTSSLDPNCTAFDPSQSLQNFFNEVESPLKQTFPEAEIEISEDVDSGWKLTNCDYKFDFPEKEEVERYIQYVFESIYETENFWA